MAGWERVKDSKFIFVVLATLLLLQLMKVEQDLSFKKY
jgi:hypothetical protein